MANFTRTRALWADDTDLLYTELEHIDEQLAEAISGQGGVYSMTEDLIIGGAPGVGLVVEADFASFAGEVTVAGDFAVYNDVQISKTLHVDGIVVFDDDLTALGNLDIGGHAQITATLYVGGLAAFAAGLDIVGNADVAGALHVSGAFDAESAAVATTFDVFGNWRLGGALTTGVIWGTTELRGILSPAGSSAIKVRTALGGDADATYSPLAYTHVRLPSTVALTAHRNYTIDDTGCQDGMRIEFSTTSVAFNIMVHKPGGTPIAALTAFADARHCVCERILGVWERIEGAA